MKPMRFVVDMSVFFLVIAAGSIVSVNGANSTKDKSAVTFMGAYTGGPRIVADVAGKFIFCNGPSRETSDSQASGRSVQPHTGNQERCVTMIDLLGIILFLAIIAAHFGLCCKGPYSKLPD